jgi:cytochrome c oxidase subunit 1/cytochrome c oxidase subunit I+III
MHWTGLIGMPRRIYTYPAELGWGTVNLITSIGAFVLALGLLLILIDVLVSLRRGAIAGPNPWDAPTLEWATPSPPPPYNFAVIPVVASRHPLWEDRLQEGSGRLSIERGLVLDHGKETLATTVLDAEPDVILPMPEDSPSPFLTTIAMTAGFAGLLLHWWWLAAAGGAATLPALIIWLWPRVALGQRARFVHG